MLHPITKQKIITEGKIIATLEITETKKKYSIASRVFPKTAIEKLKIGEKVNLISVDEQKQIITDNKINISIAEATINDVAGTGYFGNYVADMLMSELLECDKIRLIDRSALNMQIDETNLSQSGYLNKNDKLRKGQIAGVRYMIFVAMQRPDVTNVSTGIPIKSILTAAGAIANTAGASNELTNGLNTSADLSSNVRTAKLKASVSLTARVVDVATGEVMFMCSSNGKAEGKSQLNMEEGALGGLQIRGGVDGFRQTVTGKAIALAYRKIGNNLKAYFNGETSEKVIERGFLDSEMTYRKGKVFMGINKLSNKDLREICDDNPQIYFDFKKYQFKKDAGFTMKCIGASLTGLFLLDIITGDKKKDYYPHYDNENHVWQEKINDTYYTGGITFSEYGSVMVPALLTIGSAAIFVGGHHLQKSGKIKLKKCIDTYNQSLSANKDVINYNLGISPEGLALRINF